MILDIL